MLRLHLQQQLADVAGAERAMHRIPLARVIVREVRREDAARGTLLTQELAGGAGLQASLRHMIELLDPAGSTT